MAGEWQGYQELIWQWSACGFAFFIVLIRIYVDWRGLRKVKWYRDVLVFLAWLFWAINTVLVGIQNDYNLWNHNYSTFTSLPHGDQVKALKANVASLLFINTMLYMCKVDLLFLYHNLAPRASHPKMFWFIIVGWVWVIGGYLCFFFYMFLTCIPMSGLWTPPASKCFKPVTYNYMFWTTHFSSDLVVYIIPCVIIKQIKGMSRSQKWSAASMFIIGLVNISCVVVSLVTYEVSVWSALSNSAMWRVYGVGFFMSSVQVLTAIIVVCMPQLKPFYRLLRGRVTKEEEGEKGSPEIPGTPEEGKGLDDSPRMKPKVNNATIDLLYTTASEEAAYRTAGDLESGKH